MQEIRPIFTCYQGNLQVIQDITSGSFPRQKKQRNKINLFIQITCSSLSYRNSNSKTSRWMFESFIVHSHAFTKDHNQIILDIHTTSLAYKALRRKGCHNSPQNPYFNSGKLFHSL